MSAVDEIGERLNELLSNPAQLEKLSALAKSFMGGEQSETPEPDPRLFESLSRSLGEKSDDRRLLEAMKPFLSEKRRGKVDRALKLAHLASLAELAMENGGGDGGI